jgi:hypothetical protein
MYGKKKKTTIDGMPMFQIAKGVCKNMMDAIYLPVFVGR